MPQVQNTTALRSWMLFVDGENLTIRAQELAKTCDVNLVEGKYFRRDCFMWLPNQSSLLNIPAGNHSHLIQFGQRAYYYTSAVGSDDVLEGIKRRLWSLD